MRRKRRRAETGSSDMGTTPPHNLSISFASVHHKNGGFAGVN